MQKRKTIIRAKDDCKELKITIETKQHDFDTYNAVAETTEAQHSIEDKIFQEVFLPRFFARNIQII